MNYILLDTDIRNQLLPFTHTRPIADIRCGIYTMRERWEHFANSKMSTLTVKYLSTVFPCQWGNNSVLINASVFADDKLSKAIQSLTTHQKLQKDGILIAAHCGDVQHLEYEQYKQFVENFELIEYENSIETIEHIWEIFSKNESAIISDFNSITSDKTTQAIPAYVSAIAPENIFIEKGAILNPCIINASKGPVYIGANAEIMEGCMLRGPIALGNNAVLKMGAKIYGGTTIGEGCKVGGEVSNSVFFANSNKGHDGFIGNAVIGEWCNLGADTNCSNLKNNYDLIKIWDEYESKLIPTHLQFCGLMMGDHSKTGINTMLNTGTVVGVSCNVFGSNFPDKFVPSFSWGAAAQTSIYDFDKAMETAARMMERRGLSLTKELIELYRFVFEQSTTK